MSVVIYQHHHLLQLLHLLLLHSIHPIPRLGPNLKSILIHVKERLNPLDFLPLLFRAAVHLIFLYSVHFVVNIRSSIRESE